MFTFEIIFIVLLTGYFVQTVIFLIGARKKYPRLDESDLPTATVIVAARNEEQNILRCLRSLDRLEYPDGKLEILIIDDHSTDNTGTIISDFIEGKQRFKKLESRKEFGKLRGKTNALANGLEVATGEIILTTDADCEVSPSWAKTIASYYTPGVALVNGFTAQLADGNFTGMQNLDFLYLLTVASGTINLGAPLSCIGNNMSYRLSAYREVGGYETLPFSVTEDFNLLMAIHALKKYKIIFPKDVNALVTSHACPDFKSLYRQKKRWSVGGLKVPLKGYLIMTFGFFTHVFVLLSPFFFSTGVGALALAKILLDFMVLFLICTDMKIPRSLKYFPAFELYYLIYVILIPFVVIADREVHWKGRSF